MLYAGNLYLQKLLLQPQHLLNEVIQLEDGKCRLLDSINKENEIKLKCKLSYKVSYRIPPILAGMFSTSWVDEAYVLDNK